LFHVPGVPRSWLTGPRPRRRTVLFPAVSAITCVGQGVVCGAPREWTREAVVVAPPIPSGASRGAAIPVCRAAEFFAHAGQKGRES
jgi:hypothetical protein